MEIRFHLYWLKSRRLNSKSFKLEGARVLFDEYVSRISNFVPCQISDGIPYNEARKAGTKIWLCDKGTDAKALSSEKLAEVLEKLRDSGTRELHIAIGSADGFSKKQLDELKPDLKWSFGPVTLPHELAAVVASEQIYRAFTIIRKMPYHSGH